MNWRSDLLTVGQEILNSPRLAAGTYATTASIGLAAWIDVLHGVISGIAMVAGVIATLMLARVHWIKYKNEIIRNKILSKTAAEMGADVDTILEGGDE